MSDKLVGIILVICIINYFFVGYDAYQILEITKYGVIVFGFYGSFKLIG